jgi:L-fuculose-phosphate aldolase
MHLLFYRLRPSVKAACHAHPPTATGFTSAGRGFDEPVFPEVIMDLGSIPLAPYGTPCTQELCDSLEPFVAKRDAVLLENHGVVTWGKDLTTAFQRLNLRESCLRLFFKADRTCSLA